ELLREVRRKYFHTEAGYQASVLLAQNELNLGHPLAASLLLDEVVLSSQATSMMGDGVIALHRVACRLAGRSLPRSSAGAKTQVVTQSDPNLDEESEAVSDWRVWIDQRYDIMRDDSVSRSRDYPFLGGNAARNETAEGQMPISTPRWMLETTTTPLESEMLRRAAGELASSGRLIPPSWTPIRVGGQLLMRTTDRLRGVNYSTGKRVWAHPFAEMSRAEEPSPVMLGRVPEEPEERLKRKVWNDLPYGQLSSDGERVFLLEDLSRAQILQMNGWAGVRNVRPAEAGKNTLVALELPTEGKMLWKLGQESTVESELNEAFFLGPPLAIDGSLYVLCELTGDILLVCLDPATGATRWKQQLLAIESTGIESDPIRRVSGAMPTYHEGVLICPTGAGATVAVDLADRMLRWGNLYQRRSAESAMFNTMNNNNREDLFERWHNANAIASGTDVLVTPVVADNLYCFDLVTGKRRFNKARDKAYYLAGVRDEAFFVVSGKQIASYSIEKGRLNWRSDVAIFNTGQQVAGRGVFGGDSYFLPVTGNELLQISLEDGSLIERRRPQFPLGNLIAVDGEIISQSPTHLAVAFGQQTLGPRVEKMLSEDPDNLDALIQKALLMTELGKRQETLELLDRAREIDPESDEVLTLSIQSMLGELRENTTPPPGLEEELNRLIDMPNQRLEFLALRIGSALKNRSPVDAVDRLIEFSSAILKWPPTGLEDELILRDPTRKCSLDSWLAARAADTRDLAVELGQLEAVQQRLADRAATMQTAASKDIRSFLRQFTVFELGDLPITLADRKQMEGEWSVAERVLFGRQRPASWLNPNSAEAAPKLTEEDPASEDESAVKEETEDSPEEDSAESPGEDQDVETETEGTQNSPPATAEISVETIERMAKLATMYDNAGLPEDAVAVAKSVLLGTEADASPRVAALREPMEALVAQANLDVDATSLEGEQTVSLSWQTQPNRVAMLNNFGIDHSTVHAGQSFAGWKILNQTSNPVLQNPFGSELSLPRTSRAVTRRPPTRGMILSGGVMILQRPGHITAVNLFAVKQNQINDAILWTRDFGAEEAVVSSRNSSTTIFGDTIESYPVAGMADQEFRIGPVQGDQVYVLISGDLLALDVVTGETLWRNSAAPSLGSIVADEQYVSIVTYRRGIVSEVTRFNRFDGARVDQKPWKYGKPWANSERFVLAYEEAPDASSAIVRLVNPITEEVVLQLDDAAVRNPRRQDRSPGMGRILQQRWMVLFDST
ncbi:MAG: PQQ-binding-like beta-propeller repeat protein, partial [Planctomycetota bacterium]